MDGNERGLRCNARAQYGIVSTDGGYSRYRYCRQLSSRDEFIFFFKYHFDRIIRAKHNIFANRREQRKFRAFDSGRNIFFLIHRQYEQNARYTYINIDIRAYAETENRCSYEQQLSVRVRLFLCMRAIQQKRNSLVMNSRNKHVLHLTLFR